MLSPEALSDSQKSALDHTLKTVLPAPARTGVLVGVMKGRESWDLRPLLLGTSGGKGALNLVRLSNPGLALQRERQDEFRRLQRMLMPFKERISIVAQGELEGQFWTRRRFFQKTLLDMNREDWQGGSFAASQVAQRILYTLRFFHQNSLVHGHLCLENIALDAGQPVFLDFGYGSFDPQRDIATLAPEVAQGGRASSASDIFGLGLVLQVLLGANATPEQSAMLAKMLAAEPHSRASLEDVERVFLPAAPAAASPASAVIGSSRGMKAGRLLGPNAPASPASTGPSIPHVKPSSFPAPSKAQPLPEPRAEKTDEDKQPLPVASRPWLLAVLAAVSCLGVLYYYGVFSFLGFSGKNRANYRLAWQSGDQALMRDVANAALHDDEEALSLIVQDALKGQERPRVRSKLLSQAFNPRWAQELQPGDRKLALTMGLAGLGIDSVRLPSLTEAHPGVLLAAVSDLSLSLSQGQFETVPLSRMTTLPPPYGMAFGELSKLGISNLGEEPARALSHILVRDNSSEIISAYLGADSSDEVFLARLLIILPTVKIYPETASFIFPLLKQRGDILARRVEWFSLPSIANWNNVSHADKIFLVAGLPPEIALSFEQYADLLKYPAVTIKRFAAKQLAQILPSRKVGDALSVLASDKNDLNRDQVISLLYALKLEGPDAYSLFSKWFGTQPSPDTVLDLLLARRTTQDASGRGDPFNVEASRYLSRVEWSATNDQLRDLTQHEEMLARALAYAKLSPIEAVQGKILEEAVKREPNQKLRDDVLQKLGR